METGKLEMYWNGLPTGKENAVDYDKLSRWWGIGSRAVRTILHELSSFDNGDDYVLIRSSKNKGFYKTDDVDEIKAFKNECLHKGRSVFAPVRKINRVLNNNDQQFAFENNLRTVREMRGLSQKQVVDHLNRYEYVIDIPMLSKMENGICAPTPYQLWKLAALYGVQAYELINGELYETR